MNRRLQLIGLDPAMSMVREALKCSMRILFKHCAYWVLAGALLFVLPQAQAAAANLPQINGFDVDLGLLDRKEQKALAKLRKKERKLRSGFRQALLQKISDTEMSVFFRKTEDRPAQRLRYMRRKANQGNFWAMLYVADAYYAGGSVQTDASRAGLAYCEIAKRKRLLRTSGERNINLVTYRLSILSILHRAKSLLTTGHAARRYRDLAHKLKNCQNAVF
ncbi:MAG: hypothetical protein ACR2PW_08785 [Gammaproteobacteria bacterium]